MKQEWAAALVLAASIATPPMALAAPPAIVSGAYDNTLLLAVGPGGEFRGYFAMSQPGPVEVDCITSLRGKLAGTAGTVTAYDDSDPKDVVIDGRIESTGPGMLRITLPDEPPGCGNIWAFANKDLPADFTLQHAEPWIAVRAVKAKRAYFSPAPGAAHGRAYLVRNDGVGVRATQNGWVQADFVGETSTKSGWLKESDLYPP
jgi:hypothetical protein